MNKFLSTKIILCAIIVIALLLRFYQLGQNPPSLDWDEVSLGYNAYSILHTGRDEYGNLMPLSIRSFDDYKPALYVYLDIIPVAFFGLNEVAVRLPSVILGTLSVLVTYFLVCELFDSWDKKRRESIALLASFFMAVSPWSLQFSRAAFEGNIGLFFFITGVWLFFKALKRENYFYLSSISFLLSLYSYHSFRLIIPLLLCILLFLFRKEISKYKTTAVLSATILFLCSLPIWVSLISPTSGAGSRLSMVTSLSDSDALKNSARRLVTDRLTHNYLGLILDNRRVVFAEQIIKGYTDHFSIDFLFVHGDGGRQHHATNMGMLYLFELPFILAGLYFLTKHKTKRIFILLIIFLLAPLPSAITTGTPHPVRAIAMIPPFHIFTAVGLYFIYQFIKRKYMFVVVVLFVLCLGNFVYYLHQYYVVTPIVYGDFWQYGYKEAFAYAKANEKNYDKIIVTYQYDQPYIYYLFYNKLDPVWYQHYWNNSGNGQIDRFYRKIGKYEFENIDYTKDSQNPRVLLIGTPKEIPQNAKNIKQQIYFLNNTVAFRIVST